MKILLIIIISLSITNYSNADNVKDFQIEEISLYDSALKHFSKTKIDNSPKVAYIDKTYTSSGFDSQKFQTYDSINITYKTNDEKYIIVDIVGNIYMDYKECMKEIKKINSEFDELFPNAKKAKLATYKHLADKSGNSKISDILWKFKSKDLIVLACYDWSSQMNKKKGWPDTLRISISSKEANNFFSSNPYKS